MSHLYNPAHAYLSYVNRQTAPVASDQPGCTVAQTPACMGLSTPRFKQKPVRPVATLHCDADSEAAQNSIFKTADTVAQLEQPTTLR